MKNTIESRDVRVGSDANQQRTSADGRLLLMRCDVIEATRQMLSSRERLDESILPQAFQADAEDNCRYLLLVLDQLQQQTSADFVLTEIRDQMLADGVTDHRIMHHSDPSSYLGFYFGDDHLTLTFIESFTKMTSRQEPVSLGVLHFFC